MKTRTLICPAEEVLNLLKNDSAMLWRVEKKQPVLVPHEKHAGTWEWPYASRNVRPSKATNGGKIVSTVSWSAQLSDSLGMICFCPYGQVGDRLLVKEALYEPDGKWDWHYAADRTLITVDAKYKTAVITWAYHQRHKRVSAARMPHWASRLLLELIGIQFVQRPVQGNSVWGWVLAVKRVDQ